MESLSNQQPMGIRTVSTQKKLTNSLMFSLLIGSCLIAPALSQGASIAAPVAGGQQSPGSEQSKFCTQDAQSDLWHSLNLDTTSPGDTPDDSYTYGLNLGSITPTKCALKVNGAGGGGGGGAAGSAFVCEMRALQKYIPQGPLHWTDVSSCNGTSAGTFNSFLNSQLTLFPISIGTPSDCNMAGSNGNFTTGGTGGPSKPCSGLVTALKASAAGSGTAAAGAAQQDGKPSATGSQAQANQAGAQASGASSAGEDALQCMQDAFEGMTQYLVNVANEDAGSPCASDQVSKTYENAVWMVMQMYKACFLPMAILFLLPGAIITNTKVMVSFGILSNGNDEDAVNPFAGIFRSIIAIFLIPASQMIVSYMVDVGNSLEYSCQPYINIPLIIMWCEEQVQIFSPDQQGNPIKNQPVVPMAPWRGKAAGMPVAGAVMEQISGLDGALADLANESMHILSEGLTITYAFQLVMICYLLCLGPLAAAFFAWPAVGRDLFRKCFASWVDAVVILSLWKFWWSVVLICMTVRLQSGGVNPFDPFEVYYLIAFLCILMFVPFNPFDFKPGEIVGSALEKAQAVAQKVASAGASGGGGQGGSKGGQSPTK